MSSRHDHDIARLKFHVLLQIFAVHDVVVVEGQRDLSGRGAMRKMMMLFSDAKAVAPPAMLKACITLTLGLTTNSPAFVTCPITYTLLPLTSCTETVTTGSAMYFLSQLGHQILQLLDAFATRIDLADQGKGEGPVRAH